MAKTYRQLKTTLVASRKAWRRCRNKHNCHTLKKTCADQDSVETTAVQSGWTKTYPPAILEPQPLRGTSSTRAGGYPDIGSNFIGYYQSQMSMGQGVSQTVQSRRAGAKQLGTFRQQGFLRMDAQ
eukprot:scaffold941_cov454-Pavlova_lutheri.AAC.3